MINHAWWLQPISTTNLTENVESIAAFAGTWCRPEHSSKARAVPASGLVRGACVDMLRGRNGVSACTTINRSFFSAKWILGLSMFKSDSIKKIKTIHACKYIVLPFTGSNGSSNFCKTLWSISARRFREWNPAMRHKVRRCDCLGRQKADHVIYNIGIVSTN